MLGIEIKDISRVKRQQAGSYHVKGLANHYGLLDEKQLLRKQLTILRGHIRISVRLLHLDNKAWSNGEGSQILLLKTFEMEGKYPLELTIGWEEKKTNQKGVV